MTLNQGQFSPQDQVLHMKAFLSNKICLAMVNKNGFLFAEMETYFSLAPFGSLHLESEYYIYIYIIYNYIVY